MPSSLRSKGLLIWYVFAVTRYDDYFVLIMDFFNAVCADDFSSYVLARDFHDWILVIVPI